MRAAWILFVAVAVAACGTAPAAPPLVIRDELLQDFQRRASADELRRFDTLRASSNADDRDRALELLLFPYSDERLCALGITSVDQPGRKDWAIAWTEDRGTKFNAVDHALRAAGVPYGAYCDLAVCGWYVPREEFFRARRVLLEDADVVRLGVTVVTPRVESVKEP
jgi:hypothetical protein